MTPIGGARAGSSVSRSEQAATDGGRRRGVPQWDRCPLCGESLDRSIHHHLPECPEKGDPLGADDEAATDGGEDLDSAVCARCGEEFENRQAKAAHVRWEDCEPSTEGRSLDEIAADLGEVEEWGTRR